MHIIFEIRPLCLHNKRKNSIENSNISTPYFSILCQLSHLFAVESTLQISKKSDKIDKFNVFTRNKLKKKKRKTIVCIFHIFSPGTNQQYSSSFVRHLILLNFKRFSLVELTVKIAKEMGNTVSTINKSQWIIVFISKFLVNIYGILYTTVYCMRLNFCNFKNVHVLSIQGKFKHFLYSKSMLCLLISLIHSTVLKI